MRQQIEVVAELRKDVGKGASRRLRRADESVPGIIYGGGREPQALTFNANALKKQMESEAFYSQVLDVVVAGDKQSAVLRDVQRNPASEKVQHLDFLRVSADQEIDVHIPLHFLNEEDCVGVRLNGGSIVHNMNEVEVRCLPRNLPEYIEIDMAKMDVGDSIHLSDLALPEDVVILELTHGEDHDSTVVTVLSPRGGVDEEAEEAAEEAAAEAAAEEAGEDTTAEAGDEDAGDEAGEESGDEESSGKE
ncbi:MAG: 50S ribosomal protein L25/general stress protein Ctc [Gammaproteobacteria bacterium]|nr:50S ribosomal protein L25/general stress protein Ctc [Gammaproteobacteria bacterium]